MFNKLGTLQPNGTTYLNPIESHMHARDSWELGSSNWHYHNNALAASVRKWRETNTLTAVK